MTAVGLTLLGVGLSVLLWAERTGSAVRTPAKLVASTGFLLVAIDRGALDSSYGTWILTGLALSWIGDAALLGRSDPSFLGGLGAFLFAHVAYIAAFAGTDPTPTTWTWVLGALWTAAAALVARWLLPHVKGSMRTPVIVYLVVISSMVLVAGPAGVARSNALIPLGAIAFAVSDIAVARNQFVDRAVSNRLWGLPLYYLGQLLFALSVGGAGHT